jgi:hypothetical protein
MLMAPEITVDHQKAADDIINKAGDAALKRYKEISGKDSKIDYQTEVSDESAGGIVGSIMHRRIKVDNTLDERLKILEEKVSRLDADEKPFEDANVTLTSRCCQRSERTSSERIPTESSTT